MEHEIAIRLIFFILIFILVALLEIRMPRRTLTTSKKWRWFNNLSIIAINPVLLRLVFPVFAVGMAQTAQVMGSLVRNLFGATFQRASGYGHWPFAI